MRKNSPDRDFDYSIITAVIMLFLFYSPFTDWWSRLHLPWYLPYLLWLAIILLTLLTHWRSPNR